MIEHRTAKIFLDAEGIVWFRYKDEADITIEDSYDYVKIINEIVDGKKRFFILDARGAFVQTTEEHRTFMGQNPEALKWRIADAILVDVLPNRILSNFYKNKYSQNHPIKIFKDEESAKEWFKTIKFGL